MIFDPQSQFNLGNGTYNLSEYDCIGRIVEKVVSGDSDAEDLVGLSKHDLVMAIPWLTDLDGDDSLSARFGQC